MRAFPNELAVIFHNLDFAIVTADLTVVTLSVQLCVHDVVVDELHDGDNSFKVILHIRNLNIADSTARRQALEFALKSQLAERINLLPYIDVIGVGDVLVVGNILDDTEALLQALGELVGRGFQRRAVQRIIDILSSFPFVALIVHVLHDFQRKGLHGRVGMALAEHCHATFIQTCIAETNSRIAVVEQLVNSLTLFQTRQSTVLPQNRSNVGECTLQTLMTALQCAMAQVQTLIKDTPESIFVLICGKRNINEIYGDNALIETTIVFRFTVIVLGVCNVIPAVTGTVRCQEASAAHAGIHIAVSFGLAFGQLVLAHLLFADIIRNHTTSGTFCGHLCKIVVRLSFFDVVILQHINQFRECGSDEDTSFVLDALITLAKHLLDAHSKVVFQNLVIPCLIQIHEYRDERGLSIGGHKSDDLILNRLDTGTHFFTKTAGNNFVALVFCQIQMQLSILLVNLLADCLTAHINKFGKVSKADTLTAVLAGCNLCNNLSGNVASSREAMGTLNQSAGNHCAILQHVIEVEQVAVVHMLGIVISIMEMNDTRVVSLDDIFRQKHTHGKVFTYFASHIISLNRNDLRILIGILLLDLFVPILNQRQDSVIGSIMLTHSIMRIPILDISTSHLMASTVHQNILNDILNLLNGRCVTEVFTGSYSLRGIGRNIVLRELLVFCYAAIGFPNRNTDFLGVKLLLFAGTFDNTHISVSFRFKR